MGYWDVPSVQDVTALPEYKVHPFERRHFCGRSFYVRPIVAMPDTSVGRFNSGNAWGMWAPTWVIPICDDKERVRTTVIFSDLPVGVLRVIQGDRPGDIPQLVPAPGTFPHIGFWSSRFFPDWERGIGITPETAVDVGEAQLRGTGARVAEVPEAFAMILPPDAWRHAPSDSQAFAPTAQCSRWRLTLDRAVTLRGLVTHRVVRTSTVYVTRGENGCHGAPVLEIPKLSQPPTLPLMYMVPYQGRDTLAPRQRRRPSELRGFNPGWTTVRPVEPIWFEPARTLR
jgi:hypothetical protein